MYNLKKGIVSVTLKLVLYKELVLFHWISHVDHHVSTVTQSGQTKHWLQIGALLRFTVSSTTQLEEEVPVHWTFKWAAVVKALIYLAVVISDYHIEYSVWLQMQQRTFWITRASNTNRSGKWPVLFHFWNEAARSLRDDINKQWSYSHC